MHVVAGRGSPSGSSQFTPLTRVSNGHAAATHSSGQDASREARASPLRLPGPASVSPTAASGTNGTHPPSAGRGSAAVHQQKQQQLQEHHLPRTPSMVITVSSTADGDPSDDSGGEIFSRHGSNSSTDSRQVVESTVRVGGPRRPRRAAPSVSSVTAHSQGGHSQRTSRQSSAEAAGPSNGVVLLRRSRGGSSPTVNGIGIGYPPHAPHPVATGDTALSGASIAAAEYAGSASTGAGPGPALAAELPLPPAAAVVGRSSGSESPETLLGNTDGSFSLRSSGAPGHGGPFSSSSREESREQQQQQQQPHPVAGVVETEREQELLRKLAALEQALEAEKGARRAAEAKLASGAGGPPGRAPGKEALETPTARGANGNAESLRSENAALGAENKKLRDINSKLQQTLKAARAEVRRLQSIVDSR